jgi:hypothetical protein
MKEFKKYKIRLNKIPGGSIMRSDGTLSTSYDKDFYITIPVFKSLYVNNYVDVEIDPLRLVVERQEFNPYFIELDFFQNIESVLKENTTGINSVEDKSDRYGIDINK